MKQISLQCENPFRYLLELIKRLSRNKILIDRIFVRTRADYLILNKKSLIESLKFADKVNLKIEIGQIGFENFTDKHLKIYNKGYNSKINFEAISTLLSLKNKFKNFDFSEGNNIILFNPWTTLKDIKENLKVISELRKKGITCSILKLNLYGNYLPIFKRIEKEGLLINKEYKYEYRFKDKNAALLLEIYEDFIEKINSKEFIQKKKNLWNFQSKNTIWICSKLLSLFYKYKGKSLKEKRRLIYKDLKIWIESYLSLLKFAS